MRFTPLFLLGCSLSCVPASAQITLSPTPARAVGQTSINITNLNPNLVEGREFLNPQSVALDLTTNPPGLYVADTNNNRVLGFRSAVGFSNGQKADIVIGQVNLTSTFAQGPGRTGSTRNTGLAAPGGLVVDSSGNLYVADLGNNRILRFPKPFAQSGDQLPDLVLGQPGFTTNAPNQGGISAATLAFVVASGTTFVPLTCYLAIDSSGNLWVSDGGNNRILRYNASVLGSQAMPGPDADVVLGQQDFVTNTFNPGSAGGTSLAAIALPAGIAFDSAGRLFVVESQSTSRSRILVWNPPFRSGQLASRIVGFDAELPQPPPVSELQFNANVQAIFAVGNQIGVADTQNSRLLLYPPVEQWGTNMLDQPAAQVIGQPDFNSGTANQGQPSPSASTLAFPAAAVFSGTELYIADSRNHRVIVMPRTGTAFGPATRVLGQDNMTLNTGNLIEGREFDFSLGADAGIAVDLNANPPHLYVADTYNNRILGYNDLRNIPFGAKADIVIGQPDFQHSLVNYPSGDPTRPNQSGLYIPTGLYLDPDGNLYVADTGNGRVLRFPKPFENYKAGALEPANLVLGQLSFFSKITDPTARTMAGPYGLAQASGNGLLVSDVVHSRVLFFPGTSATFTNGETATLVFGQRDFNSAGAGSGANQLNGPHHISTDSDDRLYVADTGNHRISIFDHAPTAVPNPFAALALTAGLNSPRGMYVSPVTGDIWVADVSSNVALRYPAFNKLATTSNYAPNAVLTEAGPVAITQDAWGNVFIADITNRVVIHYPGLAALNAANYLNTNGLAPGMIAALYSTGNFHQFGTTSETNPGKLPLPKTLNGVQVLFNGSPVPLFFAGTDQINFQVPIGAPDNGIVDIQVLEAATGRLLGTAPMVMLPADPGIFTQAGNGIGAAVATNKDGTLNTETNPAIAGDIITLYGTGQGFIDGAPPDGDVANKPLQSSRPPTVIITPEVITGDGIPYAGLAPTLVGVWQINVRIPSSIVTLPTNPTQVVVIQNSFVSGGAPLGRPVFIYVCNPTLSSCKK